MAIPIQNVTGKILAIDYGTERIGLALSDPLQVIAGGAGVVHNSTRAIEEIHRVAETNLVVKIVVGMPYMSDGSKGSKAIEVDEFIVKLKERIDVPIETWDESFTSVKARQVHLAGGMKKKDRREKGRVDEMAARLLLQDYLDSMSRDKA